MCVGVCVLCVVCCVLCAVCWYVPAAPQPKVRPSALTAADRLCVACCACVLCVDCCHVFTWGCGATAEGRQVHSPPRTDQDGPTASNVSSIESPGGPKQTICRKVRQVIRASMWGRKVQSTTTRGDWGHHVGGQSNEPQLHDGRRGAFLWMILSPSRSDMTSMVSPKT